jgi:hypothetical protein
LPIGTTRRDAAQPNTFAGVERLGRYTRTWIRMPGKGTRTMRPPESEAKQMRSRVVQNRHTFHERKNIRYV